MISKNKLHELQDKAKGLEPIVRIGKNGLSEGVIEQIRRALLKRKLIKVKLLNSFTEDNDKHETLEKLLRKTGADLVSMIGFNISLYYGGGDTATTAAANTSANAAPKSAAHNLGAPKSAAPKSGPIDHRFRKEKSFGKEKIFKKEKSFRKASSAPARSHDLAARRQAAVTLSWTSDPRPEPGSFQEYLAQRQKSPVRRQKKTTIFIKKPDR
jgi:RNA-binding protein